MKRIVTITAILLAIAPATSLAQSDISEAKFPPTETELAKHLAAMDAALFDAAFEQCDATRVREFLVDDFEFYDDRGGMEADSGDAFAASIESGCIERERGNNMRLRRTLEPDSIEVGPIGQYGAMQMGKHSFSEIMPDGSLELRGTALFIHLWRFDDGDWRLARVISYDHQTPN